jgi:hypothetical protein
MAVMETAGTDPPEGEEILMSLKLRSALVALVLVNLLASATFALPRASRPAPAPTAGLAAAWEWMVGLFAPSDHAAKAPAAGMTIKAGSHMDPDGCQNIGTLYSVSTTDAGSQMDPDGLK